MDPSPDAPIPDDIDALKTALVEARAELALERLHRSDDQALIAHLKLLIAKLKRDKFGQSSERAKQLDQLELQLEELEATATEDECAAQTAATAAGKDASSVTRKKPVRGPLPEHLPRERVVLPHSETCPCCHGKLTKIGEDITETLEVIPRQWKVIQTVREKFACRSCETITQPPAPFYPIARGRAGPNLLAMVLFGKFGNHLPLNRQSEAFAREGVDLDVSTLADWVGAASITLAPLVDRIRHHVLSAARIHGDDTTVPVLAPRAEARNPNSKAAKPLGKTTTGRLWTYVRDDRPFGGPAPPAALFYSSPNRNGEHPREHLASYTGILQADAYAGYADLYDLGRRPAPITEAACWAHGRRKFFVLADVGKWPLAVEAVRRIDAVFDAERPLNGQAEDDRLNGRVQAVIPLVSDLESWMREQRAKLSKHNDLAKAMDYMLTRWQTFTRFLTDGRICMTNNAAERALRSVAVGRKNWLFAGSGRGAERAAALYTLIGTAKLNDVNPEAWLADALARINDHPASRIDELLPWNWKPIAIKDAA